MNRPYDYLELYKNSPETKQLLRPYAELIDAAQEHISSAQRAVRVNVADAEDLKGWLSLFKPPDSVALTDRERVCDAECFFLGAPLWRIKEIVARMCGTAPEAVAVTEGENIVTITLPTSALFRANVYSDYLDHIKPAHIELIIKRQRTHSYMGEYTHAQLAAHTHSGQEI